MITIEDLYGNKIEIGKAIADRAISLTINEPKFGNEVLIRMSPNQAGDLIDHLTAMIEEIG